MTLPEKTPARNFPREGRYTSRLYLISMFCQKCGKENAEDSKHCNESGTALYPSVDRYRFSPDLVGILAGILLIVCLYVLPIIPLVSLDSSASVVIAGWVSPADYLAIHEGPPYFYGLSLGRWIVYLLWLAGLSIILISLSRRVKA